MGQRKRRKGFVLKSEFCKKYDIKISEFNKKLLELGVLERCSTNQARKKYVLGIAPKWYNRVIPLHGSGVSGTYQYSEKLLKEIFELLPPKKKRPFIGQNYIIDFGKHKGRKIIDMVSESDIKYCRWVLDNFFENLTEYRKLDDKKYVAFNWFITEWIAKPEQKVND